MDRGTGEPAEVFDSGARLDLGQRRATSIEVDAATLETVEAALDSARAAIAAHYRLSLAGREGPGFLRYGPGGFYRRHRDRAADPSWPGAADRLVSLVVFLNDSRSGPAAGAFSGGELRIFPGAECPGSGDALGPGTVTIAPRRGLLVAFHAETLHEVRPVTDGIRDVIVDWYY